MEFVRIQHIDNPLFAKMHRLMQEVFPPEEVLEYDLWKEPLEDPGIRVFVAVHEGEVVGATEYRYYTDMNVAMTDFTIIGQEGLGVGRFLARERQKDLLALAAENGKELYGMFAEIYDPYRVEEHNFGGIKPMDPFVRREVLSHLGYKRTSFTYVHPSWQNDGEAVSGLDLGFMPTNEEQTTLEADLIVTFLKRYYAVLPQKPQAWLDMVKDLESKETVELLPI
ncbi:GNAT family acetyltransferase [Brevibacillus porteri]|uniref:GNAT family acetyltransferase n=1 Tax=Brevibacillus porteri TaxID=2126350 RepID=A0ABX5FK09_9BACL|nr:GNAT family acetyltransferase [Brevibacillus porteri]MED1800098.1 GNAT family N-acetyltransferase [Brevibacillus porteri]MED2134508.1 GNAT family N-acetyltransferase [Brevibacillus porteri]MED2747167.1 GNAT family N-acetyltransferase [Brevibacillus porteri]MED2812469.1 GNAT family N-acetyltransferase [Brevibacillus porteri]MED2896990.1 GNAT family N-acetyltransferase [Brevibacillus porteri]